MFIWFSPGLRQPRGSKKKKKEPKMYKNMEHPFRM